MDDERGAEEAVAGVGRGSLLRAILLDIAVGLLWAVLLAATVLFVSGVSQFIYVDF
jgi:hypothetical protein